MVEETVGGGGTMGATGPQEPLSVPSHALDASIFFANNVRVNYPHRYQSDEGGSQRRPAVELAEETDPYLARVGKLSLQKDLSREDPTSEEEGSLFLLELSLAHDEHFVTCFTTARVLGRYKRVEFFQRKNNKKYKWRSKNYDKSLETYFNVLTLCTCILTLYKIFYSK